MDLKSKFGLVGFMSKFTSTKEGVVFAGPMFGYILQKSDSGSQLVPSPTGDAKASEGFRKTSWNYDRRE